MVGVELPAATPIGGRLAARAVRPRRVSAKRSWPPGCGRFPAAPPGPDARDGETGAAVVVEGTAEEATGRSGVSSAVCNGDLPPTPEAGDGEKGAAVVVEGTAEETTGRSGVSSAVCNGDLPHTPEAGDGEKAAAVVFEGAAVCNGDLPPTPEAGDGEEILEGKAEEAAGHAGVSSLSCNGSLPHTTRKPETEGVVGEMKEGGETQSSGGSDVRPLSDQVENMAIDVMPLAFAVRQSFTVAAVNGSVENGVDGTEPLPMEGREGLGSGQLVKEEDVPRNGDGRVMGNRDAQLEREEEGHVAVRKKRWLTSVVNPPPKRRAISAIRKFPPGCGRAAVTGTGSRVEEGLVLEATPISFATGSASVADDSSMVPVPSHGASSVFVRDISNETKDKSAEGKHVAKDGELRDKCEGSSREGTPKTYKRGGVLVDAKTNGKRPKSITIKETLLDDVGVSGDGTSRNKTPSTQRGVGHSNINMKHGLAGSKLKSDGIGNDSSNRSSKEKCADHVVTDQIEEGDDLNFVTDMPIVQALMAPDICPWTQGRKSITSVSKSSTPRTKNKLKKKVATTSEKLPPKVSPSTSTKRETTEDKEYPEKLPPKVSPSTSTKHETIEDKEYPCSEDDGDSMALVVVERKNELCVTLPPCAPSGDQSVDARSKVKKLLKLFQLICRKLVQTEEQQARRVGRIDIEAVNAIKSNCEYYSKPGPIVGNVPGVDVGDEFHFRVELSIIGIHRPYQGGIDTTKVNGIPIAISIVASGGYPDELSSSDELIYTGSGGKAMGKKAAEDQKLERGNLALKNCIKTQTPVRVTHGFKGQSRGEVGHSKSKQVSTYTYDGLYVVVECWQEGAKGSMVFKYKLKRIPGQPELALHIVKETRKSKIRKGLCCPDISEGKERIPICVINTIDDLQPTPFKYITKVIYPPPYAKDPPEGCDCTNGCSDSNRCACAVKNGGEIPFNFNGAIVHAKPLIYECGPSCRCPPTCHNRVSQHGVKIPLEIFKTGETGWGVRSLSSISSGSFICEYGGELLQDTEAEKRENDEYLFDIGHNYDDEELWKGLPSMIPGLESATPETMDDDVGFTIDAAISGNVGRFINHSCSPNLYAQNVLWDHDDKRMPHIMFFAAENIPPLQELTYHYNYTIGQVRDKNGVEKEKKCFCGSSDCCGRLY